MKLSLQSVLAVGTLLTGIILAYADLKYSVSELKEFQQTATKKIWRLETRASHLQSKLDEEKVKK